MRRVQVLMSTYNGEKFLDEQIRSIVAQKGVEVSILVRDDGSTDSTSAILDKWQASGVLSWYSGKNLRSALSFMNLLCNAPDADFYAFCDQDDFWLPEKLAAAVEILEPHAGEYALYMSSLTLTDAGLNVYGEMKINHLLTPGEAVVTNPATGCTMVFNKLLKDFVVQRSPATLLMHDDWVYKACIFMGGFVYADQRSFIYYRQHGNNVVGAKDGLWRRIKRRAGLLLARNDGERYRNLCEFYRLYKDVLPHGNSLLLEKVVGYKKNLATRWALVRSKEIATRSRVLHIKFILAVLTGCY